MDSFYLITLRILSIKKKPNLSTDIAHTPRHKIRTPHHAVREEEEEEAQREGDTADYYLLLFIPPHLQMSNKQKVGVGS